METWRAVQHGGAGDGRDDDGCVPASSSRPPVILQLWGKRGEDTEVRKGSRTVGSEPGLNQVQLGGSVRPSVPCWPSSCQT